MKSNPKTPKVEGVWTALVTPFEDDGSIDFKSLDRLLESQKEAEVAGIILCGTTGESPALSHDEKLSLLLFAKKKLAGSKIKLGMGTGSASHTDTLSLSKEAAKAGADALLIVTPYYNRPTQFGLERHFLAIADAVDADIILYNIPSRTGVLLEAETTDRLAAHPKISAIKDSTGSAQLALEIQYRLSRSGHQLDLLAGDDNYFLPFLAIGATGVVSVASHLIPAELKTVQALFQAGDLRAANALQTRFFPFFKNMFLETNPAPIKYLLSKIGLCKPGVRPPLAPLQKSSEAVLDRISSEYAWSVK